MELTFDDFKNRATDPSLSKWEKIGFPDSYRKNNELFISQDILEKCDISFKNNSRILDIGCGCGDLVNFLIDQSVANNNEIYLIDSLEMLNNISSDNVNNNKVVHLLPGYFPKIDKLSELHQSFDAIIVYSVIQYAFLEQSIFTFIHKCIDLLKPKGRLLIGDIPNSSSRERFLESEEGKEFSKGFVADKQIMQFDHDNKERIDDTVILALLARFRNFGCETYVLPQRFELPFSSRREDILIIKR